MSDHSFVAYTGLLDDEDDELLLATPIFKHTAQGQSSPASKQAQVKRYLERVENEAMEKANLIINNVIHVPVDPMSSEHYTVYFHCPICLNPGHKSSNKLGYTIQHIKQCAIQNLMSAKDVICLLKQCPKTKKLKFNKRKQIRAGTTGRSKAKGDKNYELLLYDEQHKHELVQKRISKLLMPEKLCPKLPDTVESVLPRFWTMSHLSRHSEEYVLAEFTKYFSSSSNAKEDENQ